MFCPVTQQLSERFAFSNFFFELLLSSGICFDNRSQLMQFEWAWQHPVESLAVRKAAVEFKSLGGLANKIKLAYTMLTLPAWNKYFFLLISTRIYLQMESVCAMFISNGSIGVKLKDLI